MPSSFLSEHSIELILAPKFARILSTRFPGVIPLYFWGSREGGRIGRNSITDLVRVIALYPRRPKVSEPFQQVIEVKFNAHLFNRTWEFNQLGIPVFAGLPLVNCLNHFNFSTNCLWF